MRRIWMVLGLLVSILFLYGCSNREAEPASKGNQTEYEQEEQEVLIESEQIEEPEIVEKEITLTAVGDILSFLIEKTPPNC
ncbi:hypothetical protein KO561_02120 [Radiobacillus kanasensis]|uniref:hypothetical protein n=1 Tax=Radiobacillus kanasensis TaxID=2844358 RepID=UPI001E55A161|nr:hypothetical protein [Radiobacillus kanasensis]UFT99793.1 hypothetical protein KO561_02120 [Radiobacillus kanasensis]